MAKWGEGDARWRVEDLGEQGRNVNNWHWTESNALPWSKARLEELLGGVDLVDLNGTKVTTASEVTLSGEATINQRKGKIIPAYEMDLAIKWKGTGPDGAEGTGEIKLPYISEENHDEDPEVQVSTHSGGAAAEKMRDLIVAHGRPIIYKTMAGFIEELRTGGPVVKGGSAVGGDGDGASAEAINGADKLSDATKEMKAATLGDQSGETIKGAGGAEAVDKDGAVAKKKGTSGKSIEITEKYFASSRDIYECFTDPGRIRAYTGSPAEIDAQPGGKFSMFGGSIEGTFRDLQPFSLLEMDWRFSSWPDGATSHVVIRLEEQERGSVTLKLKQTNIPDADRYGNHDVVSMTTAGWKQQVLHRMRQVFGYGV